MKYESEYYGVVQMEDIVEHHGILGMRWGIRRFQNKDGSLTAAGKERYSVDASKSTGALSYDGKSDLTIKKGTKMYRVSENESDDGEIKYVTFRDNDRNFYKGFWSARARNEHGAKDVYEQSYKVNEDLKIPSRDTREKVLTDLSKDKEVISSMRSISPEWFDKTWPTASDNAKADSVAAALGIKSNIMDKYAKRIIDLGYNAVIDDNSQQSVNEMPLIVLTARKTLEDCGSMKISEVDEAVARSKYNLIDASTFKTKVSLLKHSDDDDAPYYGVGKSDWKALGTPVDF